MEQLGETDLETIDYLLRNPVEQEEAVKVGVDRHGNDIEKFVKKIYVYHEYISEIRKPITVSS